MSEPIISIDTIKRQARRAADIGTPVSHNPYAPGSIFRKRWAGAYLMRKTELERARKAKLD